MAKTNKNIDNTNNKNSIQEILSNDELKQIKNMMQIFHKNKEIEFEVSFRNISYPNYLRIIKHYVDLVNEQDISSIDSLDVSILLDDGNNYRVSIIGVDNIQNFLQKFSKAKPIEIQEYLLGLKSGDDVKHIFKDRKSAEKIYLEDIEAVIKVTPEIPISKDNPKPKLVGSEKMLYRYKQRTSFLINDNVQIDITDVQESNNIWNLTNKASNYELEIEILNSKITIDELLDEIESVLKIIQNTEIPIGKSEVKSVITQYQTLLNIKPSSHLESRNVVSIEAHHIVKFIPNKYGITDKADGDRYFLFSISSGLYLISINLAVKKIGLALKKSCQDILLDGELITNENGFMYMAFDVVYANGTDYRFDNKYILTQRLIILNELIDKCFGNLIPFTNYTDKNTDLEIDKIKNFYTRELKTYWSLFKKQLDGNKEKYFITRKLYFVPYGIDSSEVFMYADLVWKLSVYGKLTPYKLDGIVYTPINLPYTIQATSDNLDAVPMEYKWKPPSQNSIDFYIKFEKDAHGQDSIFYDNAVVRADASAYKICKLYVGLVRSGQEKPIPFKVNGIEQKANIYLDDGQAVDTDGNVIDDDTVVEFVFDITKPDIDNAYRWTPMRTRYDKTESVQKYRKRYGNNLNVAIRIWRSIINPVTEEIIASLGNPSTYQKEMDRLSKSTDSFNKPSFVYYQKTTANATGMRAFNNWIKNNMILTYCLNKSSILDIGCGRGGDLIKFINANVGEYVGIDIDNNGLYVISDSAYSRYKNLKKQNPNVPPMFFINADARALFNTKSQENAISIMTSYNKSLIETHLASNKKYSVISCQFSIHYYLSDTLSWSNFCKNINDQLETNGYFLITCFDGKLIYDQLMGKPKMTVSYTDANGRKNTFFEIVKIYSDSESTNGNFGVGMAIDLYNSLISNPGNYNREFLVSPDFLIDSLKKKCGLELVETDSFYNLYNLYQNYFSQENSSEFTSADISEKKYDEIRNFYRQLHTDYPDTVTSDMAMASFKFSMLNRYYIFKKTSQIDLNEPSRIVGMNHKINLGKVLEPYFVTNRMIIDPASKNRQINKIYHNIRNKYHPTKPSVYLIRHSIPEEKFNDEIYRRNKLEFSKIKGGNSDKTLLIYKSPDKYFYPIQYQNSIADNMDRIRANEGTYLLDSNKIVDDLNVLVALSEKMYRNNDD